MSEHENEQQSVEPVEAVDVPVEQEAVEPVDPATEMVRAGIEQMRSGGVPVEFAPDVPDPEPEPTLAEENAAKLAELEADPDLQLRREARQQREADAAAGAEFRDLRQEYAREAAIESATEQLIEDINMDEDDSLVEWSEDGEVASYSPELIRRVAAVLDAGPSREQLQRLVDEVGEDVALPLLQGIKGAYDMRDAWAEQTRFQQEAIEQSAHLIEASSEFIRLRNLNPHIDVRRAEEIFGQMTFATPEEGKEAALNAFKYADAEVEARKATAAKQKFYIDAFAQGDEKYFREQYLPRLSVQAQTDAEALILLRQITSPEPLDLDAAGLGPVDELGRRAGESRVDAMKRPGGTAEFMKRATAHMDAEIARNQEREADWAEKQKAAEAHNLKTYGNRFGPHVERPRR